MQNKISQTEATTLKDLHVSIGHAINRLGEDALWSGYKDGCVYMWREHNKVQLCIRPGREYQAETVWMEMVK